jgi:hypothetical protein
MIILLTFALGKMLAARCRWIEHGAMHAGQKPVQAAALVLANTTNRVAGSVSQ